MFDFLETVMKHQALAAALALSWAATAAQAQTLKPGLWEVSNKMQSASGEMEKGMADMQAQMAAMTPEQRKMMQDMMARQGVAIGSGGPGAMVVKVCMTKEMIEHNEVARGGEGDCKTSHAPRVGNQMKYSFTCTNPPSSGEGQVTFLGPEAYQTKMVMNTMHKGRSEKVNMDGQGKWLAGDCGAVKPMAAAKK
jgi:hypothetical protein